MTEKNKNTSFDKFQAVTEDQANPEETAVKASAGLKRVTLLKPHQHNKILHSPGEGIEVDAADEKWLRAQGVIS